MLAGQQDAKTTMDAIVARGNAAIKEAYGG